MADDWRTAEPVDGPIWLDPAQVRLSRSAGGVLRLELPDRCYCRVVALRAMPLSVDADYISLRSDDEEIGMLERTADLPDDQSQLLRDELEVRYFRPRITRVIRVKDTSGNLQWEVETDRGAVSFGTRHPRHSVVPLGPERYLVTDADNNRYEIGDVAKMDARSQRILNLLLA